MPDEMLKPGRVARSGRVQVTGAAGPLVTVERGDGTPTGLKRWEFWYDARQHRLLLDRYVVCSRPSQRHKWRVDASYNRVNLNRGLSLLSVADVDLPEDVAEEARREFYNALYVAVE